MRIFSNFFAAADGEQLAPQSFFAYDRRKEVLVFRLHFDFRSQPEVIGKN